MKVLSSLTLLIIAVISFGLAYLLGRDSALGAVVELFSGLMFIFAIIAYFREKKANKTNKVNDPKIGSEDKSE